MTALGYFNRFLGKQLIDVNDEIVGNAKIYKLSTNVLDESFTQNIDIDRKRLNIHIDNDSIIRKFSIG